MRSIYSLTTDFHALTTVWWNKIRRKSRINLGRRRYKDRDKKDSGWRAVILIRQRIHFM